MKKKEWRAWRQYCNLDCCTVSKLEMLCDQLVLFQLKGIFGCCFWKKTVGYIHIHIRCSPWAMLMMGEVEMERFWWHLGYAKYQFHQIFLTPWSMAPKFNGFERYLLFSFWMSNQQWVTVGWVWNLSLWWFTWGLGACRLFIGGPGAPKISLLGSHLNMCGVYKH